MPYDALSNAYLQQYIDTLSGGLRPRDRHALYSLEKHESIHQLPSLGDCGIPTGRET
jgi:hypothetical protein